MAGKKDRDNPRAYFMTDYALHRGPLTAVDANLAAVTQTIDLTGAAHAFANRIHLYVDDITGEATVGNGDSITLQVFRQSTGAIPSAEWLPITTIVQGVGTSLFNEVILDNLMPGVYKVQVTAITATTTWNIYAQNTANV